MTDAVQLEIVRTLPQIIAAIAAVIGLFVSVRNGSKADVIVGHVNSEKTAAEGRELTMKRELELLRERLAEQKEAAGLLAQAASTRHQQTAAGPTVAAVQTPIPVHVDPVPVPVVVVNTPLAVDPVPKE